MAAMNWRVWFLYCSWLVILPIAAEGQKSAPKEGSQSREKTQGVTVPPQVTDLLRPILDEKRKGGPESERQLNHLLYALTQQQGHAADEALVVLMCFDLGESQEEADAVIARGKRMLRLLQKYSNKNPRIAGGTYPDSMLKGASSKADTFEGAVKAIDRGWSGTADHPEGALQIPAWPTAKTVET